MGLILSTGVSVGSMLVTQAACCFTSAACNSCFSACSASVATRFGYSLFFLFNAILSWVMMSDTIGTKLMDWSYGYLHMSCLECVGVLAVHRVCFALASFHAILALVCYNVQSDSNFRAVWHNGYWAAKLFVWFLILGLGFFIPNEFFIGYGNYVTIVGAGVFIVIQLILLIDFAHTFSEKLVENYEMSESRESLIVLVLVTVGLFSMGLSVTVVLYVFYGNAQDCQLNQFFITTNLLLSLIATIVSVSPYIQEHNPRSGLTQVSIVVAYASYLVISAISNQPTDHCNPRIGITNGSQTTSIVIGSIFTFIAIIYSTTATATKGQHIILGQDSVQHAESVPLLANPDVTSTQPTALQLAVESGALPRSALEHQRETDDDPVTYNYSFFHLIFALAAMYLAMLITSWNSVVLVYPAHDDVLVQINKSWASVWVKIVSGWLVVALYIWTLVGPIILKDRDFS